MRVHTGQYLGTHLRMEASEFMGIEQTFGDIHQYLQSFDTRYSRFIPNNWLDTINTNGGGILDIPAITMLTVALEIAHLSNGAFDPTITPDLLKIGYGKSQ